MNANTTVQGPTEILARLDREKGMPIVVIAQTMGAGQVQIWRGKGEDLEMMPLHEYQRTDMLAEDDEEAMKRRFEKAFKCTAVLRKRLPRQSRPRLALLAKGNQNASGGNNAPAMQPQPNPEPQQSAGASNLPAVSAGNNTTVPASDLSSTQILEKIKETGAILNVLNQQVTTLTQQLHQATADHTNRQQEHATLTAQYQVAVAREMEDERRKREAALQEAMGGSDAIAQFQQELTAAGAQPVGDLKDLNPPPADANKGAPPRGKGGRFTKGSNAAGKGKAKPIESQAMPPKDPNDILNNLSPAQIAAIVAADRARQGGQPQQK